MFSRTGKRSARRLLIGAALSVAATAGVLAAGSPAQADTRFGCIYPRVCFYLTATAWQNNTPNAGYQDVTSSYQTLSSSARNAYVVHNTRNDDSALLHFTNGRTYCLPPNQSIGARNIGVVDKIRIFWTTNCT